MTRLPIPGSDSGNWGTILNDYLSAAHKEDGTLKDNVISTEHLSEDLQDKVNTIAGQQGATGVTGQTGASGPQGASGVTGASGTPGQAGATGPTGTPGAVGATGPSGTSGTNGATGATGATGASSTIPGPTGATGPQGPQGEPGPAATVGATGASGIPGTAGASGTPGQAGATGATGPAGATTIGGISGLQAALDSKAALSHTHAISDLTGTQTLATVAPGTTFVVTFDGSNWLYNGATVTSRPSARADLIMWCVNSFSSAVPAWALDGDMLLLVGP